MPSACVRKSVWVGGCVYARTCLYMVGVRARLSVGAGLGAELLVSILYIKPYYRQWVCSGLGALDFTGSEWLASCIGCPETAKPATDSDHDEHRAARTALPRRNSAP